jgi:putative transposase
MQDRKQIALKSHKQLSLVRRCDLLGVNRSSLYYEPVEVKENAFELMNLIRDIWLKYPFYGYRKITVELRVIHGQEVNHKRVQRLMSVMNIQAIYPKPKTSLKRAGEKIYPYLLDKLKITHANQVWMIDISAPQQAA